MPNAEFTLHLNCALDNPCFFTHGVQTHIFVTTVFPQRSAALKGSHSVSKGGAMGPRPDWFPHIPKFTMVPTHSEIDRGSPPIQSFAKDSPIWFCLVNFSKSPSNLFL